MKQFTVVLLVVLDRDLIIFNKIILASDKTLLLEIILDLIKIALSKN